VIGTVNLINAAVNSGTVRRFVFTSSIAVYGEGQLPLSEETLPLPEDPYGVAKLACELDLKAAHKMFGLEYTIFRPHNVYGERQNLGDRYRNVIGIFINQAMHGLPLTVFGDGSQTRAFTHIDDVAPIIARSVSCERACNETFNIGAETPTTVRDLARAVCEMMKVPPNLRHLEPRNEVVHAFSSSSKIQRVFGKQTYVELPAGLARMIEWAKTVGTHPTLSFKNVEIEKNMPASWRAISK